MKKRTKDPLYRDACQICRCLGNGIHPRSNLRLLDSLAHDARIFCDLYRQVYRAIDHGWLLAADLMHQRVLRQSATVQSSLIRLQQEQPVPLLRSVPPVQIVLAELR